MSLTEHCAKLPTAWRRVVAIVVVPMSALLLGAALWLPVGYVRDSQAQWRTDAIDTLSSENHAPAVQHALDAQLAAMRSSPLWSKFYKAPNSAAATTALHADVSTLLSSSRASVQSLTPIPSKQETTFTRIGVSFAASVRLNDLQSLLAAMSNHSRYLRVERLVVTAPQTQVPDENPPFAVTMDVYGYQLEDSVKARGEEVLSAQAERIK
jgi:hypothetical protein